MLVTLVSGGSVVGYKYYSTADGGESWTEIVSPTGNFYRADIASVPGAGNTFVSAGSDWQTPLMGASYSTDGGQSWTEYTDYYQDCQFLSIDMVSPDKGFAGAFSGVYSDGVWVFGEPSAQLKSEFTVQDAGGVDSIFCAAENITFTSASTGFITSYAWNFGDGASPATASTQGPHVIQYSTGGLKTISLEVDDGNNTDIYNKQIRVTNDIKQQLFKVTKKKQKQQLRKAIKQLNTQARKLDLDISYIDCPVPVSAAK